MTDYILLTGLCANGIIGLAAIWLNHRRHSKLLELENKKIEQKNTEIMATTPFFSPIMYKVLKNPLSTNIMKANLIKKGYSKEEAKTFAEAFQESL